MFIFMKVGENLANNAYCVKLYEQITLTARRQIIKIRIGIMSCADTTLSRYNLYDDAFSI